MPWNTRILRLIPTIGVGATLVFGAASAVCKKLHADLVESPQSAPQRATRQPVASRLKRTRYVAPQYPARAIRTGVSGYVTLEFVVNADGEPSGVSVIDSQPEGLFERAVLTAVKRWRYQPLKVNCTPVEIPTRQVIQFELPKKVR